MERNRKGKQRGRKTQTKEQKKRICIKKRITSLTLKISIIITKLRLKSFELLAVTGY
jgi:hypothetical protein